MPDKYREGSSSLPVLSCFNKVNNKMTIYLVIEKIGSTYVTAKAYVKKENAENFIQGRIGYHYIREVRLEDCEELGMWC